MPLKPSEIRERVLRLFEEGRKAKGARYEPDRFMAFLTEPPTRTGRRAADTFVGRRRFVRFMESAQLEFGVCFTNEEWERGFSLDEFVERVENKLAKPELARRLARTRLAEARRLRLDEPIKFGLFTAPILLAAVAFRNPVIRVLLLLLWAVIMGAVAFLSAVNYRYAKKLVARTDDRSD